MTTNKPLVKKEIINMRWITPGTLKFCSLKRKIEISQFQGLKLWVKIQENDLTKEAFQISEVLSTQGEKVKLKYNPAEPGPLETTGDCVFPMNDYSKLPEGYEDMVDMENLSEAELLYNIRIRYNKDLIYTQIGPTLLVINPSKPVPHLNGKDILNTYQTAALLPNFDSRNYKPHVFSIAAETMAALFATQLNQAIVISGESGAGKTENTKSAMKLLTSISNSKCHQETINDNNNNIDNAGEPTIETRIIACNPILEAFGNAKTMKNDNSSRFGKYVSLLVDKENKKIIGATITNYLLEKSRVCQQAVGERNYHIFYILFKGAPKDKLEELGLTIDGKVDMSIYEYLKKSECYDVPTFDDVENYKDVTNAFLTMNFSKNEQDAIWAIIAACLHLGNVDFDGKMQSDDIPCTLLNEEYLRKGADLLGLDYEEIKKALLYRALLIQGKIYQISKNRDQCITSRDSLAKELFNKMFNWLVKRLNFTIMPEEDKKLYNMNKEVLDNKNRLHIGLLDIFGFEKFKVNSFEQFCINYTNEKLQQLYINYVFKAEEKEFINENLQEYITELNFIDNKVVIDLMDGQGGIFNILDDVCKVTKDNINDDPFYQKIIKAHAKNPKFTTPKMSRDVFTIIHTAKDVDYLVNGFVFKNLDELGDNVNNAILHSKNHAIIQIYKGLTNINENNNNNNNDIIDEKDNEMNRSTTTTTTTTITSTKAKNEKFLGGKFRIQMQELMDELMNCECHFIRCLKANEEKKPNLFQAGLTLMQIRYLGVLDSIKVRKDGYPIRQLYHRFYEKYDLIDPEYFKADYQKHCQLQSNFRDLVIRMCNIIMIKNNINNKMILFGKTKVFFKLEAMIKLDELKALRLKLIHDAARKIQNAWKRYKKRVRILDLLERFHKVRRAVIQIKTRISDSHICEPYKQKLQQKKKAIITIQKSWKIAYRKIQEKRFGQNVVKVQSFIRMSIQKSRYRKKKKAIIMINRVWRGYRARKFYKKLKAIYNITIDIMNLSFELYFQRKRVKAAIIIQKYTRGYLVRREHEEKVKVIRTKRIERYLGNMILKIQRTYRGYSVRRIMERFNIAAYRIQGYYRMKKLRKSFLEKRKAIRIIQIHIKKWLQEKKIKYGQYEISEYELEEIKALEKQQKMEYHTLLENILHENPKKFRYDHQISLTNAIKTKDIEPTPWTMLPNSKIPPYSPLNQHDNLNLEGNMKQTHTVLLVKEPGPFAQKKINIFIKMLDIDIMYDTSSIYDDLWSFTALNIQNICHKQKSELQHIELGESHSIFTSDCNRIYTWGLNDKNQLGRYINLQDQPDLIALDTDTHKPLQIVSGNNHSMMLDTENNLFIWGSNQYGQLGMGHTHKIQGISTLQFLPKNEKIVDISAKANFNVVITTLGRVFAWPVHFANGKSFMTPYEFHLPDKTKIAAASCGHNFVVLISSRGSLYSFGNNSEGQLGHGDLISKDYPTLIKTLIQHQEKAENISCGFKHVICRTLSGKIYTWGWGNKGQLGHSTFKNELFPKQVMLDPPVNQLKALQVHSGFRHSIVLIDDPNNNKVFWWGTNGDLKYQSMPIRLDLSSKAPDIGKNRDMHPIKVMCSWSKSLSITYLTIADTRTVELIPLVKTKTLKTLMNVLQKEHAVDYVTPPVVDTISRYFTVRVMKNSLLHKREISKERKNSINGINMNQLVDEKNMIKSKMSFDYMNLGIQIKYGKSTRNGPFEIHNLGSKDQNINNLHESSYDKFNEEKQKSQISTRNKFTMNNTSIHTSIYHEYHSDMYEEINFIDHQSNESSQFEKDSRNQIAISQHDMHNYQHFSSKSTNRNDINLQKHEIYQNEEDQEQEVDSDDDLFLFDLPADLRLAKLDKPKNPNSKTSATAHQISKQANVRSENLSIESTGWASSISNKNTSRFEKAKYPTDISRINPESLINNVRIPTANINKQKLTIGKSLKSTEIDTSRSKIYNNSRRREQILT